MNSQGIWKTIGQGLIRNGPTRGKIENQNHQIGVAYPLPGQFHAGLFDSFGSGVQAGRVAQFHRPSVHGRGGRDRVPGCARRVMDYRPLKTDHGVYQAAFSGIGRSGRYHAPWFCQMRSQGDVSHERFQPRSGSGKILLFNVLLNRIECAPQCAVILVQQYAGRALGRSVGQRFQSRGGNRIRLRL